MLTEINKYFRCRSGNFHSFEQFKMTGLYEFYGNIFGPLIYTEDKTYDFIGVDKSFSIFDEIYYPMNSLNRIGTIIPKQFYESGITPRKPDPIWASVAQKGYAKLDNIKIPKSLSDSVINEAFIPHGFNEDLNMSKSIYHAYFATLADYDNPEQHRYPEYMKRITQLIIDQLPRLPLIMEQYVLHTADIVKYIYEKTDLNSKKGPYSFHMDYFSRLFFMFFSYYSKNNPINGRELLVGQREDFLDFSEEALDMSPSQQPDVVSPFESLDDSRVLNFDEIEIQHNTVILMNTLNPMFVHRVNKLLEPNEVVLLTHYLWSNSWPSED